MLRREVDGFRFVICGDYEDRESIFPSRPFGGAVIGLLTDCSHSVMRSETRRLLDGEG